MDAHLAKTIPVEVLKDKERELQERLEVDYSEGCSLTTHSTCLEIPSCCMTGLTQTRRLANQVFFKELFIMENAVGTSPSPVHQVESKPQYPLVIITREDVQ